MRRTLSTAVAIATLLIVADTDGAHEIGTTKVTVHFSADGTYRIEVVTDGQALREKFAAVAGTPRNATADHELFSSRVVTRFDGREVHPDIELHYGQRREDGSAQAATITLTGAVPAGAKTFTWQYGWTFASYSFTVDDGRRRRIEWLEGGDQSAPVDVTAATPMRLAGVVRQYLGLGFTHIVPKGLDHMLFVLGLFLLGTSWRALLWQVSAFTLAHTLTLGLAASGIVAIPARFVEPLIALSIAYVAVENVLLKELRPWRVVLVFAFGLLHGLGFAGVLSELGLPRTQFVPALLAFNAGVETGQLTVIAVAAALVGWWRTAPSFRPRVVLPVSISIAAIAMVWTIQRLG